MIWNFKHTTRILAESEQRLDSALKVLNKTIRIDAGDGFAALGQIAQVSGALKAASGFVAEDRKDLAQLLDACHTLTWWIDQRDHWDVSVWDEDELAEFWRLAGNVRRMTAAAARQLPHEPVLRDLTVREEDETPAEQEDV